MKADLFQSCGPCWAFECSTFTASSFRIWNSLTGIPSLPLALFVVMLPKAHLTSHSRCLALGEWSHHRDYLGREDRFLYSSSVYSCHLFLISSASVRSIWFLSFIEPILAWNVPLVSLIFLKRSLVLPILLLSSISLHWSLRRLSYLPLLFFGTLHSDWCIFPFLLCLSLLFFSQLFVGLLRQPFCLSHFFSPWEWFWSPPPVQCHEPLSIFLQALYLSDLIPWIPSLRILEWVAIPFSREYSWPRDQTQVSCIAERFFTIWATREA